MSAVAERVEQALTPVVAAAGFDLEAVEVQPAGQAAPGARPGRP